MDETLSDGVTDESNYVWIVWNFPRSQMIGYFPLWIRLGTFTMNSADGRMDGMDDRHTDTHTDFQVEL